jgi:hypothetical protein
LHTKDRETRLRLGVRSNIAYQKQRSSGPAPVGAVSALGPGKQETAPTTDLFVSDIDRQRILEWIISQGATIVPVRLYSTERYDLIDTAHRISELVDEPQLLVIRDDWAKEDFLLMPIVNEHVGPCFAIGQRRGGPSIQLLLYPERVKPDGVHLGRGTVDYYPYYYPRVGYVRIEPPDALKQFYTAAKRQIVDRSVLLKKEGQKMWIDRDTLNDVVGGKKLIGGFWSSAIAELDPKLLRR